MPQESPPTQEPGYQGPEARSSRLENFPITLLPSMMGLVGLAVAFLKFQHFYHWEVPQFLSTEDAEADLEYYERDWLIFYDPEERQRRHDYWAEEEDRVRAGHADRLAGMHSQGSLCPCGSGLPFEQCCRRKIH